MFHFHIGGEPAQLDRIEAKIDRLLQGETDEMNELKRLQDSVGKENTVIKSGEVLLAGLSKLIRDNAGNPVALTALADSIDASTAEFSQAIVDNTPAAAAAPTKTAMPAR